MRLSWAVLSCQTIILMLSGLAIGMEVMAFINDLYWNSMMTNKKERFSFQEFVQCKMYNENGTSYLSNQTDYDSLFKGHIRDLPFEQIFLEMMGTSFVMYIIVMNVYIGWKNIMVNIYICIVSNLIGTMIHMVSFGLILTSTLMYTDPTRRFLGSTSCYTFHCLSEACSKKDFRERAQGRHDETRACMEKLHVCQLNGFKDRVVFLVLGCIVASSVALVSSCRRLRRRRSRRITPKVLKTPASVKKLIPRPSLENSNRQGLNILEVVAAAGNVSTSTDDSSSNDFKAS